MKVENEGQNQYDKWNEMIKMCEEVVTKRTEYTSLEDWMKCTDRREVPQMMHAAALNIRKSPLTLSEEWFMFDEQYLAETFPEKEYQPYELWQRVNQVLNELTFYDRETSKNRDASLRNEMGLSK